MAGHPQQNCLWCERSIKILWIYLYLNTARCVSWLLHDAVLSSEVIIQHETRKRDGRGGEQNKTEIKSNVLKILTVIHHVTDDILNLYTLVKP